MLHIDGHDPDGEIRAPSGRSWHVDPTRPPKPSAAAIIDWVRVVRGGVLAGALNVEVNMDALITSFLLDPEARSEGERAAVISQAILPSLNFDRKVKVTGRIATSIHPESAHRVKSNLGRVKAIRNALAHSTAWLVPDIGDDGHVSKLTPHFRLDGGEIELSKSVISSWNLAVLTAITHTRVLVALANDPSSNADLLGDGALTLPLPG